MKRKPEIIICKNEIEFKKTSVRMIADFLEKRLEKSNTVSLILSGGSTPVPVYTELSKQNLDWSKIELFLADERHVPQDHRDSNFKMVYDSLINHLNPKPIVYPFNTQLSPKASIEKMSVIISPRPSPKFDLVILGIGEDGHTASIFPNTPITEDSTGLVGYTQTQNHKISDRLTLTFKALLNSRKIIVLLKGKSKEKILKDLLSSATSNKEMPAKRILEHKNIVVIFCPMER